MNSSQRNAIKRILTHYKDWNRSNGVTSVRLTVEPTDYNNDLYVRIKTRRSDCSKSSPRGVMTEQRAFILIGPRGKRTVLSAYEGLNERASFIAKRIKGTVKNYGETK